MTATPFRVLALIFASVLCLAPPAFAKGWQGSMTLGLDRQSWTDIDDPQGEFDFVHPSVSIQVAHPPTAESRWGFAMGAEYRAFFYRFDGLPVGDAWDEVHVVRLAPRVTFALNEKWSLFGGPVGEYSGTDGAQFADAVRGGASFGASWRPNENFSIGLGLLGLTKLGDDFLIQPIVLIDWQITDALRLSTRSWTSRGGTLEIIYSFRDTWEASLAGGRERERFRLDGGSAMEGDGVGEENSLPVTLTIAKTLSNGIKVSAYGGVAFNGELRVEDGSGDKLGVSDFDRSFFYGMAVNLPF